MKSAASGKSSISNVWLGFEFASVALQTFPKYIPLKKCLIGRRLAFPQILTAGTFKYV